MGACVGAEASKTIKASNMKPQKAVIRESSATVQTDTIAPRVGQNVADPNASNETRIRVKIHLHELVLNENVEEPWICMADSEAYGCQSDDPHFQPGMASRYQS